MATGALMRGAIVKTNLDAFDKLSVRHDVDLRAHVDPEVLRRIDNALRTTWLPVADDVAITEAVASALGEGVMRRWSADTMRSSLDGPLLRPLIEGAAALFGLSPGLVFRTLPRFWGNVYRGCGEWVVRDRSKKSARLDYVGVPEPIADSGTYLAGIAASLEAVIGVTKSEGTVVIDPVRNARTELRAQWT
jgi:hypothetical protein